jgi:ribosomal protein S6
MSEKNMPAVEVSSYELAFHVLPTVAEGEVETVFQNLKDAITKHDGNIISEEAPARFDLAYEIVKYLEGRNRKFSSAYFGWVRFEMNPEKIAEISEMVEADNQFLRHLIIKLTKVEAENPFFFHEALDEEKQIETVDVDEVLAAEKSDSEETPEEKNKEDEESEAKEAKA